MKQYLLGLSLLLGGVAGAQVRTMSRVPAGENPNSNAAVQAPAALQTPASLFVTVLTCTEQNLAEEYQPVTNFNPQAKYYGAVILDNPLTNNNPAAVMIVVPVRPDPLPFALYYDNSLGKWKIRIDHNSTDDRERMAGMATPSDPKFRGTRVVEVLPYVPRTLKAGDKFNILINQ